MWCGWFQAVSQVLVAICFLYMAYVANTFLGDINKGLHKMTVSMQHMESSMIDMNNELHEVNKNVQLMNRQVGGVRHKLTPWRMFSPF